jgi:hypothetical protein
MSAKDTVPFDPVWGLAGGMGIPERIAGMATGPYLSHLEKSTWANPSSSQMRGLRELAEQRGVGVADPSVVFESLPKAVQEKFRHGAFMETDDLRRIIQSMTGLADEVPRSLKDYKSLISVPDKGHQSVLAHEMGHAEQGTTFRRLAGLGKGGSGLGGLLSLWSDHEDFARYAGIGGSAAMLPTLLNEFDASRRGSRLLKQVGEKSMLKRLKAFAGMPTYALGATLPYAAYKLKDYFGGYSR